MQFTIPNENAITQAIKIKKQLILCGPPGTGKTWIARNYAESHGSKYEFVTFHPSFSYEDFIESINPMTEEKELIFRIEDGIFKKMAKEAYNTPLEYSGIGLAKRWYEHLPTLIDEDKDKVKKSLEGEFPKFHFVIDEINRGDISKIFGELITLLEKDKRLFGENEMVVTLPYSKNTFGVPPNLYLIGTMNTADRSIALMDVALRRRFAFLEIMLDMGVIEDLIAEMDDEMKGLVQKSLNALKKVNERILVEYDRDHQIGHSYYLQLKDAKDVDELKEKLKYVWRYEILPLLQEYFYGSPEKLQKVLYPCEIDNLDVVKCYRGAIENIEEFLNKIEENKG